MVDLGTSLICYEKGAEMTHFEGDEFCLAKYQFF